VTDARTPIGNETMTTEQFDAARGKHKKQPASGPSETEKWFTGIMGKAAGKATAKRLRHGRGIRPDNSVMNRLESAYAEHLANQKASGEIYDWKFHAFTLKIADPPNAKCATWSPDFAVWTNEMVLQFHDTKGFMEDHAIVRIKVAASQFPHPVFIVKKKAKKDGGGFDVKEV
jgi:hypothetical protein